MDIQDEEKRRPRFYLLVGLTVLAFTTISSGVGIMQAYYAARGISATNGTGITQDEHSRINIQSNILFPLGHLLLLIGLAIIFSIFLLATFYTGKRLMHVRRRWVVLLLVFSSPPVVWAVAHFDTYKRLAGDLSIHEQALPIFALFSLWFTAALILDDRTRRK